MNSSYSNAVMQVADDYLGVEYYDDDQYGWDDQYGSGETYTTTDSYG